MPKNRPPYVVLSEDIRELVLPSKPNFYGMTKADLQDHVKELYDLLRTYRGRLSTAQTNIHHIERQKNQFELAKNEEAQRAKAYAESIDGLKKKLDATEAQLARERSAHADLKAIHAETTRSLHRSDGAADELRKLIRELVMPVDS